MEKKIVVTKRFRNNTYKVYQYLLKEYSAKTAFQFLNKLEQRIELIIAHPSIGKPSKKVQDVRSIILTPHNQIFYRLRDNTIEILCLFDMRRDSKKKPY